MVIIASIVIMYIDHDHDISLNDLKSRPVAQGPEPLKHRQLSKVRIVDALGLTCHVLVIGVSINGVSASHHPFIDSDFPLPSSYWGTPITMESPK